MIDEATRREQDREWDMMRDLAETYIPRFRGEYAFLSNMYDAPVTYNGVTYGSAEAAFQAQKAAPEVREKLFGNASGKEARRLGRKVLLDERQLQDWNNAKDHIMREIVEQKFRENPELGRKLAKLHDAYIEEVNTWGDDYWGLVDDAGVFYGENRFGKILMQVAQEIYREQD